LITEQIHENFRELNGLAPGVRCWKRNIAPIAQLVETQGFEEWGFFMCRTTNTDHAKWTKFEDAIDQVVDAQLEDEWKGQKMDLVRDKFIMPVSDDYNLEGADARACAAWVQLSFQ
jgi:hypothetical protein